MKLVQFDGGIQDSEERRQLVSQLLKNQVIIEFLKEHNYPTSIVETFPYRFELWLKQKNMCLKCRGYRVREEDAIGSYMDLNYEHNLLQWQLTACQCTIDKEKETGHLRNYLQCDLSSSQQMLDIENITIMYKGQVEVINKILTWIQEISYPGFYLYGNVGVGKSYIAACVCNNFAKKGKKVAFVHVPEWVRRMKKAMEERRSFDEQLEVLKKAEFVVFDDIGAESCSPWFRDEVLFPILNYRMEEKKITWFTSNEDFVSLKSHFKTSKAGEEELKAVRLMARIENLAIPYQFIGKDLRNAQK